MSRGSEERGEGGKYHAGDAGEEGGGADEGAETC